MEARTEPCVGIAACASTRTCIRSKHDPIMGDRRARQTCKRWSLASSLAIFSWASAIFILLPTHPSAFIRHALIFALLSPRLTPTRFLAMASALRTHEEADFSER